MRISKLKHPLAVLRQINNLGQKELAQVVGCSVATIQSIELNRLALSEKLAQRISNVTGVSVNWLLHGDPKIEPWDYDELPYRKTRGKPSERVKAYLKKFDLKAAHAHAKVYTLRLALIINAATRAGKWRLAELQIESALAKLSEQYLGPREPEPLRLPGQPSKKVVFENY